MSEVSKLQLLAEVEDLLRLMPRELGSEDADTLAWIGRASAVINMWNFAQGAIFQGQIRHLYDFRGTGATRASTAVVTMLHQARHDLRLRSVGPLTVAVGTGGVFDYFDEVRKVIESARMDLLFVDAYLDASFISRYLPHVSAGVQIRLLTREKMAALLPAVELMRQQSGLSIEVRSAAGFHDRYVFLDGAECYQSGASFKDGAKKAPTTLTQIVDAFQAVSSTYEQIWASGARHD